LTVLQLQPEQQRRLFLVASGVSTAGSFAGITAKGWILMDGSADPFLLALNFAALSLPTLLISGPAGVRTDRVGCERVLVQSQWALLAAAGLGALAIPLFEGMAQVILLLSSTLLVGIAGAYELTARNKYCSILVGPKQLGSYLTSFSVVFNVGKLVGPPIGGWLLAATGPTWALGIDAASYLLPIASVMFFLQPDSTREIRSTNGKNASLKSAWRQCGPTLQGVLTLTAVLCLVGFFHPGLAPLIAFEVLGGKPTDLGLFTERACCRQHCWWGGAATQQRPIQPSTFPHSRRLWGDYSHCPTGHVKKSRSGVQLGHGLSDWGRHRRPLEQLQPDHSNRL
jgi:MFS family permease